MSFDSLQIVADLNAALAAGKDSRANVQGVVDGLRAHLSLRACFVILEGRDDSRLTITTASGLSIGEFRKLDPQTDGGVFRNAFEKSESFAIPFGDSGVVLDIENSAHAKLIGSPLVLGGNAVGLLAAISESRTTI